MLLVLFLTRKVTCFFLKQFLLSKKKYSSGFSATAIKTFIYNYSKKKWVSHDTTKRKWPRTQDLDKFYIVNSALLLQREVFIYIKMIELTKNHFQLILPKKKHLILMIKRILKIF